MTVPKEFAKPDHPRGTCQACGRSISLNNNGTIRHHGGERTGMWNYRTYECPGTGYSPKEAGVLPHTWWKS